LCSNSRRGPRTWTKWPDPDRDHAWKSRPPRSVPSTRWPECSNGASAKDPPAFNAHSLGGAASGLAQHVFRSPARIQLRSPNAEACAPRRQTKNAVRYIGHFSWDSPSIHKVESAGPGTVGLYRAANPSWDVSPNRRQKSGPSIVTRPQVWRRGFSAGTIRWQIVNNGLDANFIGSEIT
jgi:hypothetical protein